MPCKGTAGEPGHPALASFSDHLFLLRDGVPVGRLSFDVVNTADDTNRNNGNNNSNSTTTIHSSISNNTNDGDNDNSHDSHNNNVNDDGNDNPDQALNAVGIGRGYDASIPAVFKAKVCHRY